MTAQRLEDTPAYQAYAANYQQQFNAYRRHYDFIVPAVNALIRQGWSPTLAARTASTFLDAIHSNRCER